jgi:hypothetical protein
MVWYRPLSPVQQFDPEVMRKRIQTYSPAQTFHFWQVMKQGGIDAGKFPAEVIYEQAMVWFWSWLALTALVAAVGGALLAAGIWTRRQRADPAARD